MEKYNFKSYNFDELCENIKNSREEITEIWVELRYTKKELEDMKETFESRKAEGLWKNDSWLVRVTFKKFFERDIWVEKEVNDKVFFEALTFGEWWYVVSRNGDNSKIYTD